MQMYKGQEVMFAHFGKTLRGLIEDTIVDGEVITYKIKACQNGRLYKADSNSIMPIVDGSYVPNPSTEEVIKIVNKSPFPLPKHQTSGSSGIDLHADISRDLTLFPGTSYKIHTGIHLQLPPNCEAQIRPRSSISGDGILVHFGTIDNDYRGELLVVITNVSNNAFWLQPGDRIAQLVFAPIIKLPINQIAIEELSKSSRGEGGFGSTGKSI